MISPKLLQRLSDPDCYPDNPETVKLIQTHISIVCLTDHFAYKIKKPVRFKFLDFSTLELREHYCREEVRLNRRLCPDMYLDVIPLYRTSKGTWTFHGGPDGEIVDYAVLMKRMPEDLEMDKLLRKDLVSEGQIREVARIIAEFHGDSAQSEEVKIAGSPANQLKAILDNFREPYEEGVFEPALFESVKIAVTSRLDALVEWLQGRSQSGFIVEGHGDLHSGNIFLTDPPTIFDCIEFSPEIRCGDAAVENSLLMMDLIYSGHSGLARNYLAEYAAVSGDVNQGEQMPMLISYVAMVRAKVAALSAADGDIPEEDRRESEVAARRYLQLAGAALLMNRKIVIQVCGLPGGGKSHLCGALAGRFGWRHFSSDRIRKELAGFPEEVALPEEFYSEEFSALTYSELQKRTGEAMGSTPVVVDANFGKRSVRAAFSELPTSKQSIVWVECDEDVVRDRLLHRSGSPSSGSDAGFEVYQKLKETFESPLGDEGIPLLRVDGAEGLEVKINRILGWLLKLYGEQ